jgi:hypothetical protein
LQQPLVLLGLTSPGQQLANGAQSGDGHVRGRRTRWRPWVLLSGAASPGNGGRARRNSRATCST